MADQTLEHQAPAGSLAICPAGIDCAADATESADAIIVAVDPGHLALAAAEDSALEAHLVERMSGYDEALLDLARSLVSESADDYRSNALPTGICTGVPATWIIMSGPIEECDLTDADSDFHAYVVRLLRLRDPIADAAQANARGRAVTGS